MFAAASLGWVLGVLGWWWPELPSPTRGSLVGAAARSSASSCRGVPASRALADLATLLATVLAFPFPCPSAQSCARGPQGPAPSPTRHRGQGQATSPSSTSGSAPATLSAAGGWRQRPSVPARWPGAQWSPVRSCAIPAGPWRPGPGPLPLPVFVSSKVGIPGLLGPHLRGGCCRRSAVRASLGGARL